VPPETAEFTSLADGEEPALLSGGNNSKHKRRLDMETIGPASYEGVAMRQLDVSEIDAVAGGNMVNDVIRAIIAATKALYESKYCNSKVCVELGEPELG
jgi:hypothetical protein